MNQFLGRWCLRILVSGMLFVVPQVVHAQREGAPKRNTAATPTPWANQVTRHEGFVEQAKKGGIDILFMGDSITDGWDNPDSIAIWQKYYAPRKAANFGIGGDRTEHVLWRITRGELEGMSPKVIVLMIGTNNTGNIGGFGGRRGAPQDANAPKPAPRPLNTDEEIAGGVAEIVKVMREKLPQSKILLLAIFPRGDKENPVRQRIKNINAMIAKLDDGKMIRYLDLTDKFLAPDGTLSRDIMPDLLHPNGKGYQIWADAMEPTLAEMLK